MSRFSRIWPLVLFVLGLVSPAVGQDSGFSALARLDAEESTITDTQEGVELRLHLSQGVPYRVFTLADPVRLVLDFREVDWQGASAGDLVSTARVKGLRL